MKINKPLKDVVIIDRNKTVNQIVNKLRESES